MSKTTTSPCDVSPNRPAPVLAFRNPAPPRPPKPSADGVLAGHPLIAKLERIYTLEPGRAVGLEALLGVILEELEPDLWRCEVEQSSPVSCSTRCSLRRWSWGASALSSSQDGPTARAGDCSGTAGPVAGRRPCGRLEAVSERSIQATRTHRSRRPGTSGASRPR